MTTLTPPASASDTELQALEYLVRHERAKRTSLGHELGLTSQGAKDVIERLRKRGLVIDEGEEPTGKGGQAARTHTLRIPTTARP
jgi:DNA-binding MarR family transcriptional regulator